MSRLDHEEVLKTQSAAAANMTAGRYKLVFGGAVAALVIIGIVVAVTAQSGADGDSAGQKDYQPSAVPASSSGGGSRTAEPRRDSIRDVDFNNFTYGEIRLVNGRYQSEEAVCSLGSDDGGSIEFTDVNGDGLLDALVALGCFSPGGNSSWSVCRNFHPQNGSMRPVWLGGRVPQGWCKKVVIGTNAGVCDTKNWPDWA